MNNGDRFERNHDQAQRSAREQIRFVMANLADQAEGRLPARGIETGIRNAGGGVAVLSYDAWRAAPHAPYRVWAASQPPVR
jgi:hypothetical protein